MNTTRNKTFQQTDMDFLNAYLALLVKIDPEKIFVSDIVRIANVNKTTFYNHYPNGKNEFIQSFTQIACSSILTLVRSANEPQVVIVHDSFLNQIASLWRQTSPARRLQLLQAHMTIQLLDQIRDTFIREYSTLHRDDPKMIALTSARICAIWGASLEVVYKMASLEEDNPEIQVYYFIFQELIYQMHLVIYTF